MNFGASPLTKSPHIKYFVIGANGRLMWKLKRNGCVTSCSWELAPPPSRTPWGVNRCTGFSATESCQRSSMLSILANHQYWSTYARTQTGCQWQECIAQPCWGAAKCGFWWKKQMIGNAHCCQQSIFNWWGCQCTRSSLVMVNSPMSTAACLPRGKDHWLATHLGSKQRWLFWAHCTVTVQCSVMICRYRLM